MNAGLNRWLTLVSSSTGLGRTMLLEVIHLPQIGTLGKQASRTVPLIGDAIAPR
jgi:hypothetical protein